MLVLRRLLRILRLSRPTPRRAPLSLPSLPRDEVSHLLRLDHKLPHIDWGAADAWIARTEPDPARHADRRRAIAAAWLDELRDALDDDHRRWRHPQVEGLAPLEGSASQRVARGADRSIEVIERALKPIRDDIPVPPIAVVALSSDEHYYSFISHYYPDEGQWGTSGGVYINDGADSFPILTLPIQLKWAVEQTIAHELTHHALHGLELPLWVEEGLTQMMEERVTGHTNFKLDHEILERHRDRWPEIGLDRFWSGDAFHSPDDDVQELSYHLAQLLVRSLLAQRPRDFFAFARACRDQGIETAAAEHLGARLDVLAEQALSV